MTLEPPKPYNGSATTIPDRCTVMFRHNHLQFCLFLYFAVLRFRRCFQGPSHVQPDWRHPLFSSSSSTTGPLIPLHHFATHKANHHRVVQVGTPMICVCKNPETSRSRTARWSQFISSSFDAWHKYQLWIWENISQIEMSARPPWNCTPLLHQ